jgi:hypothetical protein
MIARYKRTARLAEELNLGWFEPMDIVIPELATRVPSGPTSGGRGGGGPQTTWRRCSVALREEALDHELFSPNPMRLVLVDFCRAEGAIVQLDLSDPLAFAPPASAVDLAKTCELADAAADRDCFLLEELTQQSRSPMLIR